MPRPVNYPDIDLGDALESTGIGDNWLQKLLDLDEDQLTLIIGHIMNKASIDNRSMTRIRTQLPSFSTEKWAEFAAQAGLPENADHLRFERFQTPVYELPPSFHVAVFENSWCTQDVYQEAVERTLGESQLRIFEPYIVRILALFQGRVIDDNRSDMLLPGTKYSTGGEVEHKIAMFGGIILIVIGDKPENNNMAELLLEFLSAAKSNYLEGMRVYGILTNLTRFGFFSYDPKTETFGKDCEMYVEILRDGFLPGMIHVTNKVFGLVLSAFVDGLQATVERSTKPNVSTKGKQVQDPEELALSIAKECCLKLSENVTTIEDMEIRSIEALELLKRSVHAIPRISAYTTRQQDTCLTSAELKSLARRTVESTLQKPSNQSIIVST